jgi:hypothetical protein
MVNELFYLVIQKCFSQPLLPAFLFGEYCCGTESRYFSEEFPENDVALISKNIVRIPKIFGRHCWITSSKLKAILAPLVVAKWREVVIAQPFLFESGHKDGFDLFDELHRQQMSECLASGKSSHACGMELTTDPDLAYLEFVKRYAVSDFQSPESFYELVAENSTSRAKRDKNADVVEVDHGCSPPVFSRVTAKSNRFFSLSSLESCGLMGLGHGCHALTPQVFDVVKPFVEPDLYTIVVVEKSSLTWAPVHKGD